MILAYLIFLRGSLNFRFFTESRLGRSLNKFWFSHWAMDWLYNALFVHPYETVTRVNKNDFIDWFYNFTADVTWFIHDFSTTSQTGQLRTYAAVMVAGLVFAVAIFLGMIL